MGFTEIFYMIRSNLFLGLTIFSGLLLLFFFGYFIIYKKVLKASKKLKLRDGIFLSLLIIYIFMVLGATFLDRGPSYEGNINLHLFASYRQAWNEGSLRAWQYQILNILMFMPFGFLLPILSDRFKSFQNVFFASLLFTLLIETGQYITGRGIFDLDDLFNNLLGGILGYTIIMALYALFKEKDIQKTLGLLLPILSVFLVFGYIYNLYGNKEFGNLGVDPSYRVNMRKAKDLNHWVLSDERERGKIYKVSGYSDQESLAFARDFFKRIGLDSDEMSIKNYERETVYSFDKYSLWVNKLDGSYSFTDFSKLGDKETVLDEEEARRQLEKYVIELPEEAVYKIDEANGEFIVDRLKTQDGLVDGRLVLTVYDGELESFNNNIVGYEVYSEEELKSSKEAYEEILKGDFSYHGDRIEKISIVDMTEDYLLDSKGYYQPVYSFDLSIDDDFWTSYIRRVENR